MKKLFTFLFICSLPVFAQPVDINQADAATLSQALNGIGPKKAEAIVKYRAEHGAFKSLEDLEKVSGIGAKTIQLNEKDIVISGAGAANDVGSKAEELNQKPVKH